MSSSDLLTAFFVTVAGGLAVYVIRRKIEGSPVQINPALFSAETEAEGEIYA